MMSLERYVNSATITPGTPVQSSDGVFIACTVAGVVALKLASGSVLLVPVDVGGSKLDDLAIVDAPSSGTTATAVVSALYRRI